MSDIDPKNQKFVSDLELAMRFWAKEMRLSLNERFGKDKVGHILILFPFGQTTGCSWISNARRSSVVAMLRHMANAIENTDAPSAQEPS
jgi:hypothetical protein